MIEYHPHLSALDDTALPPCVQVWFDCARCFSACEPTGALAVELGNRLLAANSDVGTTTVITRNAAIGAMFDRIVHFADRRLASERRNQRLAGAEELVW